MPHFEHTIGNGTSYASAEHMPEIEGEHSISENPNCYWIRDCIFDAELKVFKQTLEGKEISKMIFAKKTAENIMEYVNTIVLEKMPYKQILLSIELLKKEAFKDGEYAKACEIKKVLQIRG